MIVYELTQYLETIAPLKFQEPYDNAGLLVGDPDQKISGVLVSLDCTPEVVLEAAALGCNVIVSHHPIIFSGIKKFDPHYYVHQSVILAIKHDIALYAIHTNLDNVFNNGVNQRICQQLDLIDLEVLRPNATFMNDAYRLSTGMIGSLATPVLFSEFCDVVKAKMHSPMIKHTKPIKREVRRIAVCGGAGSFLIKDAIRTEADVFLTSDIKYHEFFEANGQLVVMDIGHYETEYFTIELLFEHIKQKFPNFAAHCTKTVTNPVQYY